MTTPSDIAGLSEPDHIWLQNADDAKHQGEGRMWCEDKVWPDDPEDGEPTKYVRADLFDSLTARVKEADEACQRLCGAHGFATGHGDSVADMIDEIGVQIGALKDRALRAEQQRDEALERAAEVAEAMPWFIHTSPKHVRGIKGSDVAAAIRRLASSPEGGSEGEK